MFVCRSMCRYVVCAPYIVCRPIACCVVLRLGSMRLESRLSNLFADHHFRWELDHVMMYKLRFWNGMFGKMHVEGVYILIMIMISLWRVLLSTAWPVLNRHARRGGFVIYVWFVYFHFVHQSSMTTMKGVLDIGTVIFYDDLFSWKLEKMAYFPAKSFI